MKNKFLAVIVCLAMLFSFLAVGSYAAVYDVEIDLGDLFGPSDDEDIDTGKGDNSTADDELGGDETKPDDKPDTPDKDDNKSDATATDKTTQNYDDLYKENEKKKEAEAEQKKEWINNFTDIKESDWYYATVKYVSENGIMNGVESDKFVPASSLTRAMLVTILYRADGSPRSSSDSKFSDVEITDWYGAAVIWASENGIVNGISETEFAPNNAITREQIATILYRYASAKKYDVTQGGMAVKEYSDYETISSWAKEAMQWAVNAKLINGKTETTVNPLDNATRAEAATVIMRFIEANK